MTPERWQHLKQLYCDAVEASPGRRAEILAEAYSRDRELGHELEALLKNHEAASSALDRPIVNLREPAPSGQQAFADGEVLLGQFKIVRHIKSGGMGQVYEAIDLLLPKSRLALKIVLPSIAQDASALARFKEEVMLARQVKGAHICPIYAMYASPASPGREGLAFFTMEFLEGVTLADRIAAGLMPPKDAMRTALQLCEALRSIHEAGIVHRDLKPNNIMLVPRNGGEQAVVMDFGLARSVPTNLGDAETGLTQPGMIMGNPGYMAPEQFEPGARVSPATDIYSFGIVLYEMVTGKRPFPSSSFQSAAMSRSRPPGLPSSIRRGLPAVWDDVISRCLENDPARRYQSADQIIEALHQHSLVIWRFSQGQRIALTPRVAFISGAVLLVLLSVFGWSVYRALTIYRPSEAAKRWYDDGVAALRDGTYLKAANALAEAVKSDPKYALAHARLADAWAELDSTGQAQQEMLLAAAAEQKTSLPDEDKRYVDAVQATLIRDYSAAAQDYEEILKQLPDDRRADGLVDLGRAYEKAGKVKETMTSYEQAAKLSPDDPAPFVHLGIWKSRQRDPAGAEVDFARAEKLYRAKSNEEGLAEVAYERGYAANDAANSEHARQYLEQSLTIARQIPSPQLEARSLSQMSNVEYDDSNDPKGDDKAIEYANQAIQIAEANNLDYWKADGEMRLANAYLDKDDFTAAEFNAQQALHSAQVNDHPRIKAAVQLTLASIRDQQGINRDEQIAFAQSALKYYRDYGFLDMAALAAELVARGQKAKGEFSSALQTAQELLELAHRKDSIYYIEQAEETVGDVYYALESYPDALSHYERALEASKTAHANEAYEAVHCAGVLWRLGRYDEAEQMLATIPPDARARADIGSYIEENRARMQLSRSLYRDALVRSERMLIHFPNLSPGNISDCMAIVAQSEAELGQLKRSEHDADQLLAFAEKSKDQALIAQAELVEADVLVRSGFPTNAEDYARSANLYFSEKGEKESQWLSLLYLAEALEAGGDAASAAATAKQALDILAGFQQSWPPSTFQQYSSRRDNQTALRALSTIKDQKGLEKNDRT